MARTKRTPCVGICSTTYGDLVCRGCKRFAHEIVQWNGYDEAQQTKIWQRLHSLRAEVLGFCLHVTNAEDYQHACEEAGICMLDGAEQQYELLRFLVSGSRSLSAGGLAVRAGSPVAQQSPQPGALQVIQTIDAEIYRRSLAHYERNFKVPT